MRSARACWQVAVITGPVFGGFLIWLRPELVYGLAAVLSLVSLIAVLMMRAGRDGLNSGTPDLASVLGGITLVRKTPVLLGAISLDLFAVLFGGAVALLPIFAADILNVGSIGFGFLRSAPAAGALLMALYVHRPSRSRTGPVRRSSSWSRSSG